MSVERNHEMRAFGIRRDRLYAEHLPARMPSLYLLGYVWALHVFTRFLHLAGVWRIRFARIHQRADRAVPARIGHRTAVWGDRARSRVSVFTSVGDVYK